MGTGEQARIRTKLERLGTILVDELDKFLTPEELCLVGYRCPAPRANLNPLPRKEASWNVALRSKVSWPNCNTSKTNCTTSSSSLPALA